MKALLRRDIRSKLASQSAVNRDAQGLSHSTVCNYCSGRVITAKLLSLPEYVKAKRVGIYLHTNGEVPTTEIVRDALLA